MMRRFILLLLAIGLFYNCSAPETKGTVSSTIYWNGDILTMASDQPKYVESVVVQDSIIAFAGTLAEAEKKFPKASKKNLNQRTLVPGLIDGHCHFAYFSSQAVGANLLPSPDGHVDSIPALIETLMEWDTEENRKLTGWIYGTGFDDSVIKEKRFPTRHDLDKVSAEFPIMITHISGHFAVVNTVGLKKLGITKETADPEGGLIRRENGEPNGVLEELAAIPNMVRAIAPKSKEAALHFFEQGQNLALKYGYTTAQEGRAINTHQVLANMAKNDLLKLDVVSYIDYTVADSLLETAWHSLDYINGYRIGGAKLTLDGSPQGRTAWRTQPYLIPPSGEDASYRGYPAIPNDTSAINFYKKAYQGGWQTLTHGNGDAAMDQMIRCITEARKQVPNKTYNDVLIHGQYVREDQLDAYKNLDVSVSLFPLHTYYWGDWHSELIGEELAQNISPTRWAIDKGIPLTIHTDAPVALPNLMRVLWTAVNRQTRSGKVLGEHQRLTPYEALQAITIWSAQQHGEADSKGSLEKGKLADLVILNQNPLKVDKDDIKEIEVLETIKKGTSVYRK